jgi:hypothetical protein
MQSTNFHAKPPSIPDKTSDLGSALHSKDAHLSVHGHQTQPPKASELGCRRQWTIVRTQTHSSHCKILQDPEHVRQKEDCTRLTSYINPPNSGTSGKEQYRRIVFRRCNLIHAEAAPHHLAKLYLVTFP